MAQTQSRKRDWNVIGFTMYEEFVIGFSFLCHCSALRSARYPFLAHFLLAPSLTKPTSV